MTEPDLAQKVKQVMVEVLDLDIPPAQLTDDVPLYSTLIRLDSLTLLHLLTELEKAFSCQIDDEAVMAAELTDVGSIVSLVAAQVAA
jgi:acyl carrier protein